jgi:choline dehydrogenase-like flavoprotein
MILDIDQADPLPLADRYDACIAGGGVAGITLALHLAEKKRRVLLLEAGGYEYSEASQDVCKGANAGYSYFNLDTARLRYLGGTSGHWNGQCRPLDAHDFLPREHIPDSGWPIRKTDLDPYLDAARDILELPPFPEGNVLPESDGLLRELDFQWSPPVRFGEKYRKALSDSTLIDVFLNANLVEVGVDPGNGRISHFAFRGYAEGRPARKATADRYVLALGGIENARLMLNQGPRGLANETGMVGRYFMEHPEFEVGYYVAGPARGEKGATRQFIAPTAEMIDKLKMTNAVYRLGAVVNKNDGSLVGRGKMALKRGMCASDVVADLIRSVYPLSCRVQVENAGALEVFGEQVPNPRSRVFLGEEKDRFGLRRPVLDWQLTTFEKRSIRVGALEVGKHFARQDFGRVKLHDWVLQEDAEFPTVDSGLHNVGGYHHMGTTRMAASAMDGVVDGNCRTFEHANLYIAGSSVFRTGGQANPTFTIVQLALRLGDHLAAASAGVVPRRSLESGGRT